MMMMMIIASISTLYIERRAAEGYRNWYYTMSPTAAVTVPEKQSEMDCQRRQCININLIDYIFKYAQLKRRRII